MPQFDSGNRDITGTAGHKKLHQFLVNVVGFIIEDEYPASAYSIDCYAEEVHVGFEYDGKDFHSSTAQRKRDLTRDQWIMEALGIPIMRITEADLLKGNQQLLFTQIKAWVDSYGDINERRMIARRLG